MVEFSSFKSFLGAFLVYREKTTGTPSQRKKGFRRQQSQGNCTGNARGVTSGPLLRTLSPCSKPFSKAFTAAGQTSQSPGVVGVETALLPEGG